jgi:hypothetical protein
MFHLIQPYLDSLVQALIGILVLFILAGLAAIRRKAETLLESKTTATQRQTIYHLAGEAFAYAEAVFKESNGPQKLDAAFGYLSSRLKGLGISIGETDIRAAIEKAVLEYNAKTKPPDIKEPVTVEVPVEKPIAPEVQQLIDAAKAVAAAQQIETPNQ